MDKKLIIPAEVKVCATCSYWDGDRRIDDEYSLVVIAEDCRGECLVQEKLIEGLSSVRHMNDCVWEPLEAGDLEGDAGAELEKKTG